MNTLEMRNCTILLALLVMLACSHTLYAQDVEPRRWSHLPTDTNVVGLATSYSSGDIYFDPVLELQDVETEIYGTGFIYMRTFGLAGKSARVDILAPWAMGRWSGLLSGEPASTRRHGFADPRVRFSMLVYGAPALSMPEFLSQPRSNTVVGVAVSVKPPLGEYYGDRLVNLGTNRWMIRPQLGVTHNRGKWTWELTGSFFWYGENDDFFGDKKLETDELWALQGHAIYTFRPGLWLSLSSAYGNGADAILNGVDQDLKVDNWLLALSLGVPISRRQGLKFAWVRTRTQRDTGADLDSFNVGWTLMF
jgi:hypothetical protein